MENTKNGVAVQLANAKGDISVLKEESSQLEEKNTTHREHYRL